MELLTKTTWEEVFDGWRKREANNPGWIETATKIKGWPDWESWRRFTASQIRADKLIWGKYKFTNPLVEISSMLVGPYTGWQSMLLNKNISSFNDLLEIPERYNQFREHDTVVSIMNSMPFDTEFIGLLRKDNNKIVCLEGHHRAVAIALAKKLNKKIDFSKANIIISLAHLSEKDNYLLDDTLKRGSSKNPKE